MAIINCPQCGKEISDKAKKCPACGYEFEQEMKNNGNEIQCKECGTTYDASYDACPNCGCPKEIEEIKEEKPKKKKRKIGLVIGIIIVIIAIIAGIFVKIQLDEVKYKDQAKEVANLIIEGAGTAESMCGQVHDVWYNCLFEEKDTATDKFTRKNSGKGSFYDDFNDALSNLYKDNNYSKMYQELQNNVTDVMEGMKKLSNPNDKNRELYEAMKDLYDSYMDMTNMALDGSGYNIYEYTNTFNEADKDTVKKFEKLAMYL